MELRNFLELAARDPALCVLVIGAHAVAAHGHTRATFDVDFLVPRKDEQEWLRRAAVSGLRLLAKSDSFAQFAYDQEGDALDLMLVNDPVFETMWSASEAREFGDLTFHVPSLNHLLALKLHVLKQSLAHRTAKDAEDVEMLLRVNKIDLDAPAMRSLFLKYGNEQLYETFHRLLRHP
jgi:hypothetical protein